MRPIPPLNNQADAVLYFLHRMNIDMLNEILDDDRTYQDFEKAIFIQKLSAVFEEFRIFGDTFLNMFQGHCNSLICSNSQCTGYSFVGNHSMLYMDLIIEIKEGNVLDIYECDEFANLDEGLPKDAQVYIDQDKIRTIDFPLTEEPAEEEAPKPTIRIIHADDHKIVRDGFKLALESEAPHIKVVAQAANYMELDNALETIPADLILLDGVMPYHRLEESVPKIRERYPHIKILLLWIGANESSLLEWMPLLNGQLSMGVSKKELVHAIETIMAGDNYFTIPVFNNRKK